MPDSAEEAIDVTLTLATRLGAAALILVAGYALAVVARHFVRRLLARPNVAEALGRSMARLIDSAVFYIIMALAVGRSLVALGVSETFVSTMTLVVLAILGLALNQSIANFAATVIFLLFQPFRRGDWVETMGHFGVVQEILLFNTVLLLPDQRLVSLPNSKVQESGVTNYSQMGVVQAAFSMTVAYREDIGRVRRLIAEAAAEDPRILPHPPVAVLVDDLGETGVRLLVLPTVRPAHYLAVRNDLREQIKARFDAEGIAFAIPAREVRLTGANTSQVQADHRPTGLVAGKGGRSGRRGEANGERGA